MVLESIVSPAHAETHPLRMFLYGFLFSSVGIILSLSIFPGQPSLVMVFLTVMAAVPLVYRTIYFEEAKDERGLTEKKLIFEHTKALKVFIFLFLGMTVSVAVWYVFSPSALADKLFEVQVDTLTKINGAVTGSASAQTYYFWAIIKNNMKVLLYCIAFALIYGVGAIFILTWNATVVGTAIGSFVREELALLSNAVGFEKVAGYFSVVSLSVFKYAFHGIPEMLAYFTGGLAGSIVSVALIRHKVSSKKFKLALYDAADLIILAVLTLIIAAVIEAWFSPNFF